MRFLLFFLWRHRRMRGAHGRWRAQADAAQPKTTPKIGGSDDDPKGQHDVLKYPLAA